MKKKTKPMKSEWKKVGVFGVDSGLCWIGDPCYLIGVNRPFPSWENFLGKLESLTKKTGPTMASFPYEAGHEGLGVCVSGGFGDGSYEVWVRTVSVPDWGKRVAELKVVFIKENEDE